MIYALVVIAFIAGGAFLSCVFGANDEEQEYEDESQTQFLEEWNEQHRKEKKLWKH